MRAQQGMKHEIPLAYRDSSSTRILNRPQSIHAKGMPNKDLLHGYAASTSHLISQPVLFYSEPMTIATRQIVFRLVVVILLLLPVYGTSQGFTPTIQLLISSTMQSPAIRPTSSNAATDDLSRPLPEISSLLQEVERRQKTAEDLQAKYLYHAVETVQELDAHNSIKKNSRKEYDNFWIDGVPVRRLVARDGKNLDAEDTAKEDQRIDKETAKALEKRKKEEAAGKETDPRGNDEITVSRFLVLGQFSNERRVKLNGRDTIEADYRGNPNAKTLNRSEAVIRDMVGTVWIDEEDRMLSQIEGRFLESFKIGAGLVINIRKGTSFALELKKINDEVWLPVSLDGQGAARALLFYNFNGNFHVAYSDYRKYRTSSRIIPTGSSADAETKKANSPN